MSINNDVAMWNENAGPIYNAIEYRRLIDRMLMGWDVRAWGGSATEGTGNGGVTREDDLEVTALGTPDMSVNVALGGCMVGGTDDAHQGNYFVYSDATVNVPIGTADATNDRIDIVGVQISDTEYGDASDLASITVIEGTPAASPSEPTLPDNFLSLARIDVAALDTAINTGDITDRRQRVSALGGVTICADDTVYPSNAWQGQVVYDLTDDILAVYDGSTYWNPIGPLGTWVDFTPTWTVSSGSVSIGNGTLKGRYQRLGTAVKFWAVLIFGSTTSKGSGTYYWELPFAPLNTTGYQPVGFVQITDSGTTEDICGWRCIAVNDATHDMLAAGASPNPYRITTTAPWTWATGDAIRWWGEYEMEPA